MRGVDLERLVEQDTGRYRREKTIRRYDYNSDFLLKYNKLWDRFGVTAAFGGSVLRNKYYSTTSPPRR